MLGSGESRNNLFGWRPCKFELIRRGYSIIEFV
jgi:hypothetical protein